MGTTACVGPLEIDYVGPEDAGAVPPAPEIDAQIRLLDGSTPPAVDGGGPTPHPIPGYDGGAPPPGIDAGPPPAPLDPLAPPQARYHSFDEVADFIELLAERHPDRVRLDTYGTSPGGRPLYYVRISDAVGVDEGEPAALINFAIHGDEIITVECALDLLYTLVERYDDDARVRSIVDGNDLYVVPVVSPDSFSRRSREEEGVDPNRQFPHRDAPGRRSITVVDAAVSFFEARTFEGTLDFHAFGELILLPHGESFDRAANYPELSMIASELAAVGGYEPTQISHMFGSPVFGGSVDYYQWRGTGIHLGVEMATSKSPPTSAIGGLRDTATEMALRFVEAL